MTFFPRRKTIRLNALTKAGKPRQSAYKHRVPCGRGFIMMTDEGIAQFAVAEWMRLHKIRFLHIPNEGKRDIRQGAMLKLLGLEPGASDFLIFTRPRGCPDKSGVCLEMKTEKGKLSANQSGWLKGMDEEGWLVMVGYGAKDAISQLEELGYGG